MNFGKVSIFHRKGERITRRHFDDIQEALMCWNSTIQSTKDWSSSPGARWSKKMIHMWGVGILHTPMNTGICEEIYAIEIWDRSLWSVDVKEKA
jgi:hypothetical protein